MTMGFVFGNLLISFSAAIVSFLRFCGDLVTPEVAKRLLLPLESALAMLSG